MCLYSIHNICIIQNMYSYIHIHVVHDVWICILTLCVYTQAHSVGLCVYTQYVYTKCVYLCIHKMYVYTQCVYT